MSEARPITNITEYVCSQCWTSFGGDDGVPDAGMVTCPHCGHAMPADGGGVLDAVRAAPRAGADSGGVPVSQAPAEAPSAVSNSETFAGDGEPTDISAVASAPPPASPPPAPVRASTSQPQASPPRTSPAERVAAPQADAVAAALAAEDAERARVTEPVARGSALAEEPVIRTTGRVAPGSLGRQVDDDHDDDEIAFDDVNEETLDRAASLEELMREADAAVGAPALSDGVDAPTADDIPASVPSAPAAVVQANAASAAPPPAHVTTSSSSIEAFEETGAFDPFEGAATVAGAGADSAAAAVAVHVTDSAAGLAALDEPTAEDQPAVASSGPADGGLPYEEREWKLRAFGGITYNFHGLDALLGWASSKAGSSMSVSVDGDEWRDFDPFYAALRDGLNAEQAYRTASGEQVDAGGGSSVLDEIAAHDAAHPDEPETVTRVTSEVPDEVRQTAKRSLSRSTGKFDEVITEGEKARRERGEPARRGGRKQRTRSGRTGKFKSTTRSDSAKRNTGSVRSAAGKAGRSSKSGKNPAPDSSSRLALGVGAALLVTVVAVFILHQQGVVVLPFLPR